MPRRRSRLVLLVVPTFVAVAMLAKVDAGRDGGFAKGSDSDAGFVVQAPRMATSAGRLSNEDRLDAGANRASKQRLALLAVVAAFLALLASGRRWSSPPGRGSSLCISWWSSHRGRAPPSVQLLIV